MRRKPVRIRFGCSYFSRQRLVRILPSHGTRYGFPAEGIDEASLQGRFDVRQPRAVLALTGHHAQRQRCRLQDLQRIVAAAAGGIIRSGGGEAHRVAADLRRGRRPVAGDDGVDIVVDIASLQAVRHKIGADELRRLAVELMDGLPHAEPHRFREDAAFRIECIRCRAIVVGRLHSRHADAGDLDIHRDVIAHIWALKCGLDILLIYVHLDLPLIVGYDA